MYVIGLLIIMECLGKYLVRDYQNIVLKNFDSAFFAQHNQLLCHFFHPNKRGGYKISPTQDTRTHVHICLRIFPMTLDHIKTYSIIERYATRAMLSTS